MKTLHLESKESNRVMMLSHTVNHRTRCGIEAWPSNKNTNQTGGINMQFVGSIKGCAVQN
jgi:hypothetical protein